MRLSWWRPATAVLVMLVVSVTIAACGGSGSSASSGALVTNAGVRFSACVRAHGVPDYPDPSNGGGAGGGAAGNTGGVKLRSLSESPQVLQTATQKCRKYLPAVKGPATSPAQLTKLRAAALADAECMRAHGVANFPDPQISLTGGHIVSHIGAGSGGAKLNAQSPAFEAAQKECQRQSGFIFFGG